MQCFRNLFVATFKECVSVWDGGCLLQELAGQLGKCDLCPI